MSVSTDLSLLPIDDEFKLDGNGVPPLYVDNHLLHSNTNLTCCVPDDNSYMQDGQSENPVRTVDDMKMVEFKSTLLSYTFKDSFEPGPSVFTKPCDGSYTKRIELQFIDTDRNRRCINLTVDSEDTIDKILLCHLNSERVSFTSSVVFIHQVNSDRTRIISTRLATRFSPISRMKHNEILHVEPMDERNCLAKSESANMVYVYVHTVDRVCTTLKEDVKSEDEFMLSVQKRVRRHLKTTSVFRCYRHSFSCIHGHKHESANPNTFSLMDCMQLLDDHDYFWKGTGLASGIIVMVETYTKSKQTDTVILHEIKKMSYVNQSIIQYPPRQICQPLLINLERNLQPVCNQSHA
jgi:hypothetical protein